MAKYIPDVKISMVHGKPHDIVLFGKKITVVPMYHPAAALRNGAILSSFREDFMKLPEIILMSGGIVDSEENKSPPVWCKIILSIAEERFEEIREL